MFAYLCGSIEYAPDQGKAWRRKIAPWLEQTLLHRVYDPASDERKTLSEEEAANFRQWKTTDLERFRRAVRKIINYDLDVLQNHADYVICYWDEFTGRGGGTQAEITAAYRKGIPIYLVTELSHSELSGWVLACADHILSNFDELKAFLTQRYGHGPRQAALWGKL